MKHFSQILQFRNQEHSKFFLEHRVKKKDMFISTLEYSKLESDYLTKSILCILHNDTCQTKSYFLRNCILSQVNPSLAVSTSPDHLQCPVSTCMGKCQYQYQILTGLLAHMQYHQFLFNSQHGSLQLSLQSLLTLSGGFRVPGYEMCCWVIFSRRLFCLLSSLTLLTSGILVSTNARCSLRQPSPV